MGSRERRDVAAALVVDLADLEGVDRQSDSRHLDLGGVQDVVAELLLVPDDALDGHRADDAAQVPREDPADERRHLALVGLEAPRGGADALVVVADLERDDGLHAEGQTLLGVAVLLDLRFLHRERQHRRPGHDGYDENPMTGDDLELGVGRPLLPAADEQGFVGRWDAVAKHYGPPGWPATSTTPCPGMFHSSTSTRRAPLSLMTSTCDPTGSGSSA
jgi:hypothetical protein